MGLLSAHGVWGDGPTDVSKPRSLSSSLGITTGGLRGNDEGGGGMLGRGRTGRGRNSGRAVSGGSGNSDKSRRTNDDAEELVVTPGLEAGNGDDCDQ